jgi:ribosome-associated heat shock protein Hsp15
MGRRTMIEPAARLDKWLWHARFVKTRSLATRLVQQGHVRVNRRLVEKAATAVRPGDVVTFAVGPTVRVIRVVALAARRGPAPEGRALYQDLAPAVEPAAPAAARVSGRGRPTKAERRAIEAFTGRN